MINTSYTETANMNLRIPTRSEFHKYAMETLNVGDFFTNGCQEGGKKIQKIARSITWSENSGKNFRK
ncbi:hypothetical protein HMPREF1215_00697 [Coprococcus sp. HPP0074]|nr:hypothetical protein HMPREF1215_00697 [Coprococcus sp. HPP0074]